MFGKMMQKKKICAKCLFPLTSDCTNMPTNIILTLCSPLLSHFCTQILITSRQNTVEDGVSLFDSGTVVGVWKDPVCSQRQSMLFFPSSTSSLSALSSYHAVQGWMGELRVDVGEACKLALVDVGDDQLVRRGQHRLSACEKLVKVFCSFATLKEVKKKC